MKNPRVLNLAGLSFLLLFNILNFVVRRFVAPESDFAMGMLDGAVGASMGLAAMLLLTAVRMQARGRGTPCA
jgi:hypothetical protein